MKSLLFMMTMVLSVSTAWAAEPEFESYQLVILRRGDKADAFSDAELKKIQEQHLAHLRSMQQQGHMMIAGPFADQSDATMRGMCLYRVASVEEARKLAQSDPAVKVGRLKVEVMTWWVEKGNIAFPKKLR